MRIDAIPRRWVAEDAGRHRPGDSGDARDRAWRELARSSSRSTPARRRSRRPGCAPGDRVMIVAENSVGAGRRAVRGQHARRLRGHRQSAVVARASSTRIREHARPRCTLFAPGVAPEVDAHAAAHRRRSVRVRARDAASRAAVPEPVRRRRGCAARRDRLHVRHVGPAEGRDADAREPAVRRADVRATLREHRPGRPRVRRAADLPRLRPRLDAARHACAGGACLHLVARFDAQRALDALAHDGLTVFQGVPAMYARMLERLPEGKRVAAPRAALPLRRRFAARPEPQGGGRAALRPAAAQRLRTDRMLADGVADAARRAARRHVGRPADPRHRGPHRRVAAATCRAATSASSGCAGRT